MKIKLINDSFKYNFTFFSLILLDLIFKSCFYIKGSYTLNKGIFWGFGESIEWAGLILNLIGVMAWGWLLWEKLLKQTKLIKLGGLLVLYGGVSNLFDRLLFGGVIDYINFFNISNFNIADSIIIIGMGIIISKLVFAKAKLK